MKVLNATDELDERILKLQKRKHYELELLREQFHDTLESMKPVNIIKSTFRDIAATPEIKHNLVNNLLGLATGYLSRKIIIGSTHNPIKKIAGALLQFAVTNFVGKKMERREANTEHIL